ncbi:hypothetical protein A2U01_0107692, partial [Trifolium medium]|nr:hypothetical protein [Trifolium medium]
EVEWVAAAGGVEVVVEVEWVGVAGEVEVQ